MVRFSLSCVERTYRYSLSRYLPPENRDKRFSVNDNCIFILTTDVLRTISKFRVRYKVYNTILRLSMEYKKRNLPST